MTQIDALESTAIFIDQVNYTKWKMSKVRSDLHEACKDVMNIVFRDGESLFDMEVRLYEEAGEDCLRFAVTDQAYLQKYYETTFTTHNIPSDFITIFGTLPELYEHIAIQYQETLQLYSPDDPKESLILFFSIMILNKVRKYRLQIESRPLTVLMKEENNLKKLTQTIEDKKKTLERANAKENEANKMTGMAEREIQRLKGEETDLHTRIAAQVELEQIQDNSHKEATAKKTEKQKEVGQLFQEMVKEGYTFTEEEINEFSKATQSPPERRNGKRMLLDIPEGMYFPELKEELILPVIQPKRKPRIHNEIQVLNCEDVQEVINMPDNNKPAKTPEKDSKNKEFNPESQQRRLRLVDNSEDSQSRNTYLCLQKQKKVKEQYIFPKPQSNNQSQYFINSQQNQKNQEKVSANIVTVLSSQSQEEQLNDNLKEMGTKVSLDFTQSQNIDKYKLQVIKSKTFIQRTFDDKNFYHIYHRHPIKDKQNMQISIYNINKGDFTFGIMSKEALHVSRLDWTKDCICWVGADRSICNQLKCTKLQLRMEMSDLITVAVDCTTRAIYFYQNRKFVHCEKIPQKMANQCYFFIETATKGNKVCYT